MMPWIRTQSAQNTGKHYDVSPIDRSHPENDVHLSHSNASRVSDAPEAELVSKHSRTSVKQQPYPSNYTRTTGGYSHRSQRELQVPKADKESTHARVSEVAILRTEDPNRQPSSQIMRPGLDHKRVHGVANTSKFSEDFNDEQPDYNHEAFLSPSRRRPAARAKDSTAQCHLRNQTYYRPDVAPSRNEQELHHPQQPLQPPLSPRPDMRATGYPVQNVGEDLAYLDPYEIEGAARPKPASPMVKYTAPHVADVSPYLDPHQAEIATRFTPATMATVQYIDGEALINRCPLGNLSEEDKDIIERIKSKSAFLLQNLRI